MSKRTEEMEFIGNAIASHQTWYPRWAEMVERKQRPASDLEEQKAKIDKLKARYSQLEAMTDEQFEAEQSDES